VGGSARQRYCQRRDENSITVFFALVFLIALLFSFKNILPVRFHLLWGAIEMTPLALALSIELLAGVAIGGAARLAYLLNLMSENVWLQKSLAEAEQELQSVRDHSPARND
jgi:uncharacterized integral membrane protein